MKLYHEWIRIECQTRCSLLDINKINRKNIPRKGVEVKVDQAKTKKK